LNQLEVQAYFDAHASEWDARMVRPQAIIDQILNAAGVTEGCRVLDVACGTGVLFEDYLRRGVTRITGVDLSPQMARIARRKYPQSHVEVLCGDIETVVLPPVFDCCVVYNALPHFPDPARLIARLAQFVVTGGRLCLAHSMGREQLLRHHAGRAEAVSRALPEADVLCAMFAPHFISDTTISLPDRYIAAGSRRSHSV